METDLLILILSFFVIALIYSSVGFGGGSSYLALLAIMGVHYEIIRPAALLCNIIVVTGGTYIFWKEGKLDLKKSWAFILASMPCAFIGGFWRIDESVFFILLGISLMLASVFLWMNVMPLRKHPYDNKFLNGALGGGIGFLSGLVGIGGGIFLSPILNFLQWDDPKKISGLASLFILVNSISGLAGQTSGNGNIEWSFIVPLLIAVFVGGQIGSRLGAKTFDPMYIKRITAVVIFIAALFILKDHV
ncbi:MAG: sulfite exporter TauE/SafE family protein [Cyclobacteriaceae bacterium]